MKKTYKIEVDCANCALKMEEATKKVEGVAEATVSFMTQKMKVEFAEGADEQAVMKLLDQELKHVDLIIGDSGLSAAQVLASLTLLEVKGLVVRHPGKYYSLPLQ